MNIIEAIKANETERVTVTCTTIDTTFDVGGMKKWAEKAGFGISEIMAEYAVVPKTVTITRAELAEAFDTAIDYKHEAHNVKSKGSHFFDRMIKELGL